MGCKFLKRGIGLLWVLEQEWFGSKTSHYAWKVRSQILLGQAILSLIGAKKLQQTFEVNANKHIIEVNSAGHFGLSNYVMLDLPVSNRKNEYTTLKL